MEIQLGKELMQKYLFHDFGQEWKVCDWTVVLKVVAVKSGLSGKNFYDRILEYWLEWTRQLANLRQSR